MQNSGHVKKFGKHSLSSSRYQPASCRQKALLHLGRLQWIPGSGIRISSTTSHCRGRLSTCTKPQPLEPPAWGKLPGALRVTLGALSGAHRYHGPRWQTLTRQQRAPCSPCPFRVWHAHPRQPPPTSRKRRDCSRCQPSLRCQQVMDGRCEALGTGAAGTAVTRRHCQLRAQLPPAAHRHCHNRSRGAQLTHRGIH